MARKIIPAAEKLIKEFEGYSTKSYRCPSNVWSISYGLTGPDIREGTVWTDEKCEAEFQKRLRYIEGEVEKMMMGARIPDSVFGAVVSWTYNVGVDAAKKSTLVRKLRSGDLLGAWSELPRWVHSNGVLLPGLIRRRKAEQDLWNLFLRR